MEVGHILSYNYPEVGRNPTQPAVPGLRQELVDLNFEYLTRVPVFGEALVALSRSWDTSRLNCGIFFLRSTELPFCLVN